MDPLSFFEHLRRIGAADYTPTLQDLLCMRVATTGAIEVRFETRGQLFRVFDVGGQRTQRRKWIHLFDDVNALIFVASLAEFDQNLREQAHTNRMRESIGLFGAVANSVTFKQTSIILFLNKMDVFADKLRHSSITIALPRYTGPQEYEASARYVRKCFLAQNHTPSKTIFAHETCATDTKQVEMIINSTIDIVLEASLSQSGI